MGIGHSPSNGFDCNHENTTTLYSHSEKKTAIFLERKREEKEHFQPIPLIPEENGHVRAPIAGAAPAWRRQLNSGFLATLCDASFSFSFLLTPMP